MWDILAHGNILCQGYCIFFFPRASYHLTSTPFFFFNWKDSILKKWNNSSFKPRQQQAAKKCIFIFVKRKHECLFLSPQTGASNWSYLGDRGWIKGHYAWMRSATALNLPGVQVWCPCAPSPGRNAALRALLLPHLPRAALVGSGSISPE